MGHIRNYFAILLLSWTPVTLFAQIYDGTTLAEAPLESLTDNVKAGDILILGENHGLAAHRDQHLVVLNQLRVRGLKVSVGLEFINYTDQMFVNQYRTGELEEAQFLSLIDWKGAAFEFYKPQLNFPRIDQGEFSLGLNLSRTITSKISKTGLDSLNEAEKALLPPDLSPGRDSYKQRFFDAAGSHCPNFNNCFLAQSTWDDTMAWKALQFTQAHPEQVLVIIVGEFHAQYGGGLPDRIRHRDPKAQVKVLSQIWSEGLTPDEVTAELQPSPVEGPRADLIWVSGPAAKATKN